MPYFRFGILLVVNIHVNIQVISTKDIAGISAISLNALFAFGFLPLTVTYLLTAVHYRFQLIDP